MTDDSTPMKDGARACYSKLRPGTPTAKWHQVITRSDGPSLTNLTNNDGQPITRLHFRMGRCAGDPVVNFLTQPSRMTLDFKASPDMEFPKLGELRHDLLKSFRHAVVMPGDGARVVIDMKDLPKGFDPKNIKTGYEQGADGKLYFNIDFPGALRRESHLEMRGESAPHSGLHMRT